MGKSLPYDAEVEYIEGSGTQYVNTLITLENTDKIIVDFYANDTNGFITGRNASNNQTRMFLACTLQQWQTRASQQASANTRHTFELSSGLCVLDGVSATFAGGTINATGVILIFAGWSSGSLTTIDSRLFKGRIYGFDILDSNGDYRFRGIPVRIGTTGYMYDRVSGTLFGNAGSGDFILGNDK